MIHQHFKLVDVFTVRKHRPGLWTVRQRLTWKAASLPRSRRDLRKYGFVIDPPKVYNMSVSEKQTVEIVKVLYRGADILILDEPTAVLTPQETDRLFDVMRNMKADGKAMVIITHKLNEVMEVPTAVRCATARHRRRATRTRTSEADGHDGGPCGNAEHRPSPGGGPQPAAGGEGSDGPDAGRCQALTACRLRGLGGEILVWLAFRQRPEGAAGGHRGLRPAQPGSHVIYHPPPDEPPLPARMRR